MSARCRLNLMEIVQAAIYGGIPQVFYYFNQVQKSGYVTLKKKTKSEEENRYW